MNWLGIRDRYWIFIALLLCLPLNGVAEAPPLLLNTKLIGGSNSDILVKHQRSTDHQTYLFGHSGSSNGDISLSYGNVDSWIIKLDSNDQIVFNQNFGGPSNDLISDAVILADGSAICVGTTASNSGIITNNHGYTDVWIFKIDPSGNLLWSECFGGSANEQGVKILMNHPNEFFICANTFSTNGQVSGQHGQQDIWLFSINASGQLNWQSTIGGSGIDYCNDLVILANSQLLVTGSTASSDGDIGTNLGGYDGLLAFVNSSGSLIKTEIFGGSHNESINAVIQNQNLELLMAGYTYSSDFNISTNNGFSDGWLLITNENGNLISSNTYGGSYSDHFYDVTLTPNFEIICSGSSMSSDLDLHFNYGNEDGWVVKFDNDLNIKWSHTYGGSAADRILSLMLNEDESFSFVGYSNSTSIRAQISHGSTDGWYANFACVQPQANFFNLYDTICATVILPIIQQCTSAAIYQWTIDNITQLPLDTIYYSDASNNTSNINITAATCHFYDHYTKPIVVIESPSVLINANKSALCGNTDEIQLSTVQAESYYWNTGDSSSGTIVNLPGFYQVTVRKYGCELTSPIFEIAQRPLPEINIGADTTICQGGAIWLWAPDSMASYQWQDGNNYNLYTATEAGTYHVMINDGYCTNSDTINIATRICNLPVANFQLEANSYCEATTISIQNMSTNALRYEWYLNNDSLPVTTAPDFNYAIAQAGIYDITLMAINNDGSHAAMLLNAITINAMPAQPIISFNGSLLETNPQMNYQWWLDGQIIHGATNATYLPPTAGNYTVSTASVDGCTAMSMPYYFTSTSALMANESRVRIFPNPASDVLYIASEVTPSTIRIFNYLLQEVAIESKSKSINLADLNPGFYFVEVWYGEKMHSEKILIVI
ncbi:MAG: hypothetical protein RIQ89_2155 [Bacteroidota bacterium]|jgi:hypothetical protein